MSTPSNLYAEKVFAEHPLSLWALDDKLDYLSLITEPQRTISSTWDGDGGGSNPTITPPIIFNVSITNIIGLLL